MAYHNCIWPTSPDANPVRTSREVGEPCTLVDTSPGEKNRGGMSDFGCRISRGGRIRRQVTAAGGSDQTGAFLRAKGRTFLTPTPPRWGGGCNLGRPKRMPAAKRLVAYLLSHTPLLHQGSPPPFGRALSFLALLFLSSSCRFGLCVDPGTRLEPLRPLIPPTLVALLALFSPSGCSQCFRWSLQGGPLPTPPHISLVIPAMEWKYVEEGGGCWNTTAGRIFRRLASGFPPPPPIQTFMSAGNIP